MQPLIISVKEMLKKPDFLFPFVASQQQFRTHYYGLTAASILEYFFIDMYSSYLSMFDPINKLELPPHGEKGWDYGLNNYRVSHKVAQDIGVVSTLWDATISPESNFNADYSIFYSLSQHQRQKGNLIQGLNNFNIYPISEEKINSKVKPNQSIIIVNKNTDHGWEVLDIRKNTQSLTINLDDLISFTDIWRSFSQKLSLSANSVEIYLIESNLMEPIQIGSKVDIDFDFFPGFYLLEKEKLIDITLKANNRSSFLIPKSVIQENLIQARDNENFVRMPTWFGAYAPPKPPNLYLSQKQDYDNFFASIQRR
jgi:hypothetical protein